MLSKTKIAFTALVLAIPFQAMAENAESTEKKPALEKVSRSEEPMNPWTDCGIGAMIFDETKWAAVISNVIWDYGITATTSAVSSKHTCEGKKVAAAFFINETYANIEEETANGSGTHITAMLNIFGCQKSAHNDIVASVRSEFGNAVGAIGYAEKTASAKAQEYYLLLDKKISQNYAQQCNAT